MLRPKLARRRRYPPVLLLERLFRCNLACASCGKIQYPAHVLKLNLSPEECFKAVCECGVLSASIPGREPLLHPGIDEIVEGLVHPQKPRFAYANAGVEDTPLQRDMRPHF